MKKQKLFFRIVADLNPDDFTGLYNISCTESRSGNYSEAIELLKKIIKSNKLSESYRQTFQHKKKHIIKYDTAFDPLRNAPEYKDKFNEIGKKFDKIVSSPEPPLISESSPDLKLVKESAPLPYTLKQVQIENFQCIIKTEITEIPIDSPWIFITGENGDGKTSLLQAIAIGLHGTKDAEHIINSLDKDCKIDTEIQEDKDSCVRHFY